MNGRVENWNVERRLANKEQKKKEIQEQVSAFVLYLKRRVKVTKFVYLVTFDPTVPHLTSAAIWTGHPVPCFDNYIRNLHPKKEE